MSSPQERKQRIDRIKMTIRKASEQGKKVSKEKVIASMGIEEGIARRTVLEYLHNLVNAGFVNEKEGILTWAKENTE